MKKIKTRQAPPFKAIVRLEIESRFVPDGRINFKHFELRVLFPEVRFVFDHSNPNDIIFGYVDIISTKGRGEIKKIELNDVQYNTKKERPKIKMPFPKNFDAELCIIGDYDSTAKYFSNSDRENEGELYPVYPMPPPPFCSA